MRYKVYVALSQFCENDEGPRKLLTEAGFELEENRSGRRLRTEELLQALRDADAVLAGLELYSPEVLDQLPALRCISRCGVGTDSVDMEAARRHNIAVMTTVEEIVEPVAQLTIAMMLGLARNISRYVDDSRAGLWRRYTGSLLSEWTIGLIGFGRIGRAVERYARIFGPRILVSDPYVTRDGIPSGVEMRQLNSLLAEADLISLHATRRPEEGFLIDRDAIACMKKGARLINTARGYLVDEVALYEALCDGRIAGAAVDVFENEPYAGPLAKLPQVLCTPHVATLTQASRTAMELACARNVVAFLSNTTTARILTTRL